MKHTIKKITIIALLIVFFIVTFLSKSVIATEITSTNTEKIANEEKRYTIEDVVYNKVPIFDINVFSETAGGQEVVENSPVYVIRNVVAIWYVAIRNAVAVVLAILLIYSGLRMAIATVASDKANYKIFLVGWLKSIIILFTIHYIMLIVLNLNDLLINILNKGSSVESEMYETIRTRAYDFRFSVGVPGAIMYIAMIIIFFRFVWMYIKRTFTVLILIVMAPIIAGKYAYDSASGKRSLVFSNWLYQFCANVLIQSIHALLYTSIVSISLAVSKENIVGFIISLIFLNFMVSADKIVLKIFKFEPHVQDMQKPFKKEESLEGVYYTYGLAKLAEKGVKGGAQYIKRKSNTGLMRTIRTSVSDITREPLDRIDNLLLRGTSRIGNSRINSAASRTLILRKASRRKGSAGRLAKQTLKIKKNKRNTRYSSAYKFIKNDVKGIGSLILGIPVMVVNPATGIGLLSSGVSDLKENARTTQKQNLSGLEKGANVLTLGQYANRVEQGKLNEKTNKKVNNVVESTLKVNEIMDSIEEEIYSFDDTTKKDAKKSMGAYYLANVNRINKYMKGFMADSGIANQDMGSIDNNTQREMVNYVVGIISRNCKLEESEKNDIINESMKKINSLNRMAVKNKFSSQKKTQYFAASIGGAVKNRVVKNKFTGLTNLVDDLEEENGKLQKFLYAATEDRSVQSLDIKNYIDTL